MKKSIYKNPPGFGVRQPSGAFLARKIFESGRGLPQPKTLSRQTAGQEFSHEI